MLEPNDPLLPAGYAASPAGDPFPCRVFTLDAPYSGDTQETYKVDGPFNPSLRLLFSAQDEFGSFPAYTDVTQSVEPIVDLADPTKLSGGTKHSLIKITCAVLKEVCDGLDNDGDLIVDGFTTFCGTGQCAASGTCAAGVDSCVPGTPSAEVFDGIDNDCDGAVDSSRFTGFFRPVDNLPTVNVVKAGAAVPVKFSLNGFQGYDIFITGYPRSTVMACDSGAPTDTLEETVTAGDSGLQYDAATDTYTYVWKTTKLMAGTCRFLDLGLKDNSSHTALFRFLRR
jgi:hypothetical protein